MILCSYLTDFSVVQKPFKVPLGFGLITMLQYIAIMVCISSENVFLYREKERRGKKHETRNCLNKEEMSGKKSKS